VLDQHVHHAREVLVQLRDDVLGRATFGDGGEAANVGEQHRHRAPLAAEPREGGVLEELGVDVAGDEA
jgi:hypothetical protein